MAVGTGRLCGVSVIFFALCTTPVLADFFNETEELNTTMAPTWKFPLINFHMEKEGIYTGTQVPETFAVFPIQWQNILTCEEHEGENFCARKQLLIRLETPVTVLNMNKTTICSPSNAIHGTRDLDHTFATEKRFMALWTFSVPAESCIQIFFKTHNVLANNKFYIKTGEWIDSIASAKRRRFVYERLAMNSSVISIAYSHLVYTREDPVIQFTLRLSMLQCTCPAH